MSSEANTNIALFHSLVESSGSKQSKKESLFDKFALAKAIIKLPAILHFIEEVKGPKLNLRKIA